MNITRDSRILLDLIDIRGLPHRSLWITPDRTTVYVHDDDDLSAWLNVLDLDRMTSDERVSWTPSSTPSYSATVASHITSPAGAVPVDVVLVREATADERARLGGAAQ